MGVSAENMCVRLEFKGLQVENRDALEALACVLAIQLIAALPAKQPLKFGIRQADLGNVLSPSQNGQAVLGKQCDSNRTRLVPLTAALTMAVILVHRVAFDLHLDTLASADKGMHLSGILHPHLCNACGRTVPLVIP